MQKFTTMAFQFPGVSCMFIKQRQVVQCIVYPEYKPEFDSSRHIRFAMLLSAAVIQKILSVFRYEYLSNPFVFEISESQKAYS